MKTAEEILKQVEKKYATSTIIDDTYIPFGVVMEAMEEYAQYKVNELNKTDVINQVCVSVISCPYKKDGLCTTDEQCDSKEQTVL